MKTQFYFRPALVMITLLLGCLHCHADISIDFEKLNVQLLSIITNKAASDSSLLEAISRLGKVAEPASFWTKIADDPSYSLAHRTRAVFALFRRHCGDCWNCRELGNKVFPAEWARQSGIEEISYLAGKIPVELTSGETVFKISVLRGAAIYVRVRGKVDVNLFSSFVRGQTSPSTKPNPEIAQYGFEDDYDGWIHNRNTGSGK